MNDMLPNSQEAEASIIGGIFLDSRGEALDQALKLTPDCFFYPNYRRIFEAIVEVNRIGKQVNTVTIMDELQRKGQLEKVGGEFFIRQHLSMPTSAHTASWIEILREKYLLRSLAEMGAKMQKECMNGADGSALSKYESEIFNLSSSLVESDNRLENSCKEIMNQIEARRSGSKSSGLSSGIPVFEKFFGGFQKSQYYVVAGRPSSGKTALADQIVAHFLNQGRPVLYIALEASEDRVLAKIACKLEDISYSKFARGYCNAEELNRLEKAIQFLKKSPLILIRPNDISGTEIRSLIRREKRKSKIELVVLDYLQKVTVPQKQDERRAISDASQQVQRACVETGVPALILVQLNREADKERPRMSHLKESGQIEQDADNIVLLWHEKDPRDIPRGEMLPMMMTIEKNKDGVRGYDQPIFFDGELMKFKLKAENV